MYKNLIFFLFSILLTCSALAQIENNPKTSNGIPYKIILHQPNSPQIKLNDFVAVQITIKNYKDSLLAVDFAKDLEVEVTDSPLDIRNVLPYLSKGDSAICWVKTDWIIELTENKELPPFLPKGTYIQYIFKIQDVKSAESRAEEKQALLDKQNALDKSLIEEYAKKNKLMLQKTASGLHYLITQQGNGTKPNVGQKISVHYTGKLLDGKVFDTSIASVAKAAQIENPYREYAPFEFELGIQQVIQGWDEGLALLSKGGKILLLIPSVLGYGDQEVGDGLIPANSVLLFEIELVDILD